MGYPEFSSSRFLCSDSVSGLNVKGRRHGVSFHPSLTPAYGMIGCQVRPCPATACRSPTALKYRLAGGRSWASQSIELVIFLGAALVLAAVCVWRIRCRIC